MCIMLCMHWFFRSEKVILYCVHAQTTVGAQIRRHGFLWLSSCHCHFIASSCFSAMFHVFSDIFVLLPYFLYYSTVCITVRTQLGRWNNHWLSSSDFIAMFSFCAMDRVFTEIFVYDNGFYIPFLLGIDLLCRSAGKTIIGQVFVTSLCCLYHMKCSMCSLTFVFCINASFTILMFRSVLLRR